MSIRGPDAIATGQFSRLGEAAGLPTLRFEKSAWFDVCQTEGFL